MKPHAYAISFGVRELSSMFNIRLAFSSLCSRKKTIGVVFLNFLNPICRERTLRPAWVATSHTVKCGSTLDAMYSAAMLIK